jgi:hypothetical protein
LERYLYTIVHSDTPNRGLIAQVEGPPGLDLPALYRDFGNLYDHGEADEWLEFYRRYGAAAYAANPDALLTAALHVISEWRAGQTWSDGSANLGMSFLNWLLLEHACTLVPVPADAMSNAPHQQPAAVLNAHATQRASNIEMLAFLLVG